MKKIFLAFLLITALTLPACAAENFTIVSRTLTSSDLFTVATVSDDTTSKDVIKLTGNYEFSSIKNALAFANDTKKYINDTYNLDLELGEGESESFENVSIKIDSGVSSSSAIGGDDAISFNEYSKVTTIEISPSSGSAKTLNAPGTAGRHFNFDSSATVTLSALTLEGKGGVEISSGTVKFNNIIFQNSSSDSDGGAVLMSNGTADFSGCTFNANHGSNGGAVSITGGNATFSNTTTFTGNTATNDGGAVYVTNGTVSFTGTATFNGTNSASNGGVLAATGGTVSFSGTPTFEANNATADGGAFYITNGSVTLENASTFKNNTAATNGGAVSITGGSITFNSSATFDSNKATGTTANGGALSITGGTVTLASGSTFKDNTAAISGGAILLNASGATLALNDVTFTSNKATGGYGGAVITGTSGGTLNVTDCRFEQNNAGIDGGAVYVTNGTVSFTGSSSNTFTRNTAAGNGGAVYVAGGTEIKFSDKNTFTANNATNGGSIYLANSAALGDTLTFENNMASADGGAVYVNSGTATFNGTAGFTVNTATNGNGGAVFVNGSGILSAGSAAMTFTKNYASKTAYDAGTDDPTSSNDVTAFPNGGALCFAGTGTSTLGAVSFDNNIAPVGGAVALTEGSKVNFSSASFGTSSANEAWTGGAVYIGAGSATFSTAEFERNTARDDGGAVYVSANGGLNFTTSATFTKNQANTDGLVFGNGGAVYWGGTGRDLVSAFTTSDGVTFTENETSGNNNSLERNAGNGGAVYFETGTATINSSTNITFDGNKAYNSGGAIATKSGDITFNGVTMSDKNTAEHSYDDKGEKGGYGGLVYSAGGTVTVENSTISNQNAVLGGAVCALKVKITNSSFDSNGNADNTSLNKNGGAVYVLTNGNLTVTTSKFRNNMTSGNGGAILTTASTQVTINDSLFTANEATVDGGAITLAQECDTDVTASTFEKNYGRYGGAIKAYGTINLATSYFTANNAYANGGAVYFSQHGIGDGIFTADHSMFSDNHANGSGAVGNNTGGGALFLDVDYAKIDACTFNENGATGAQTICGGAVYLNTADGLSRGSENIIDNSTFVSNSAKSNTNDAKGGGLYVNGSVTIRSSTFTLGNTADDKGGGVYIASRGDISISGTLFVGNSTGSTLGGDLWSDGDCSAQNSYNRVGVFGTGSSNTSWLGFISARYDRENSEWTTETFYSSNVLAENYVSDSVPPTIGSSLMEETQKLLTIMLSEDATLALDSRATNVIPTGNYGNFPRNDQRGVDRRSGGAMLDIGPVLFNGSLPPIPDSEHPYSIAYIQISGVPNALRRIGQTASLIAKIYYTNGRVNYGGTADGEEAVTWSVIKKSNCLKVDSKTGVITALKATDQNDDDPDGVTTDYATVQVRSDRDTTAVATANIRIHPLDFAELNNSPESGNRDTIDIIRNLRNTFKEYNMGYQNTDVGTYDYEKIIEEIFGAENAQAIAMTAGINGVTVADTSALTYVVNISEDVYEGTVTPPLSYLCSFSSGELKSILGTASYNSIMGNYLLSAVNVDAYTASRLFSVLTVSFEGKNGFEIPVLGPDSSLSIYDAMSKRALEVETSDGGIDVKLNLMLANVEAKNNTLEITKSSSSELNGAVIIPDGSNDGEIYGKIVFPQKDITAALTDFDEDTLGTTNQQSSNSTAKANNSSSSSSGDGGGGGCNSIRSEELGMRSVLMFLLLALGIVMAAPKKTFLK